MAHFQPPPDGDFGEYDVDSKLAVGSIWRMTTDVQGKGFEAALWGGSGLVVRSNNPAVIANPVPERASGALRVFRLKGLSTGTTMLEAGPQGSTPWVSLQVRVVQKLAAVASGDSMLELTAPQMALNAADTPVTYDMRYDRRIASSTAASAVIATAASMGKLKHLVISSHGYIKYGASGISDSVISIGAGLSRQNIELFSQLKGAIGGGVIWFGACGIGNDNIGNGERATRSGAYIVAPVMYMAPKSGQGSKLPPNKIDMYQRFVPKVFAPTGHLVSWSSFLRMGTVLGFKVA